MQNNLNTIKVTFPPLPEGAIWNVYTESPQYELPKDQRTFFQKVMFRVLTRVHDTCERVWHWAWRASRKYAPPQSKRVGSRYHKIL